MSRFAYSADSPFRLGFVALVDFFFPGAIMESRLKFILSFPVIAVLTTGCSEQSSTSKELTPPKVAPENQNTAKTGKAAKRKPKDMGSMTGPTDVVE